MHEWVNAQADRLRKLAGLSVIRWSGVEMAVREGVGAVPPQWYDDAVAALQLDRCDLTLSEGAIASIVTYQNDTGWGLHRVDDLPPLRLPSGDPDSIFRARRLDELPAGEITSVDVELNGDGDIAVVRLQVGGRNVSMRAAEVDEQPDGSLRIVEGDESILLQVDGRRPNPPMQRTATAGSGAAE